MYSQEDLKKLSGRVKTIVIITAVIFIGFLIAAIYVAVNNAQWIGQLILIIGVCIDIFIWGIKATPTLCYRGFVKEILTGLSRTERGRVISISDEPVYKDNRLFYYEVLIMQDDGTQRILLLDVYKNAQDLREGAKYDFKIHDNYIIDYVEV
ncbi:hypothetical protein [Mahella australiensis]|uniref:Uncharacterized protein n=1 Tax=Mahella australiensis (strain DSM 15567 / CIP 107919 / 50-1 BON) TaxID=697281 RepID=F3ZVJ9_MAHA5|nr:hypothetical protein [Mahella australiensis]AEE96361.1 hypothetical protein Mahau_1164 [Mahella australiensis 50-1 BON]